MARTYITHVAIRFNGTTYSLPAPNRHHDVIRHICETTGARCVDSYGENQGFIDSAGRYLNRKQALYVARMAGQLRPDRPVYHGKLYSENVW